MCDAVTCKEAADRIAEIVAIIVDQVVRLLRVAV
jgi:hypothetical protein